MRVSSWLPLLVASAALAGCAGPVTSSRVAYGYHVECIHRASCEARAAKVCRGPYQVRAMRENHIPDHELPGFNEHPVTHPPPTVYTYLPPGDGIAPSADSDRAMGSALAGPSPTAREPLPLVELDVVCGSSG